MILHEDAFHNPIVSIIIPTFNSEKTVGRALESVMSQTHPYWEVLVIDDTSSDKTCECVQAFERIRPKQIKLYRNTQNLGPGLTRNRGIDHSAGSWIAVLDADDAWESSRLEVLLALALARSADVVCDNIRACNPNDGCVRPETLFRHLPDQLTIPDLVKPNFEGAYNLGYLKPLFNAEFISRHRIRYTSLRTGEDLIFLLRFMAHGAKALCSIDPLYIYTTQIDSRTGLISFNKNTYPRDIEIATALEQLAAELSGMLSEADKRAIADRITYLRAVASFSSLRYSILRGEWKSAFMSLARERALRGQLYRYFADRAKAIMRSHREAA